MNCDEMCIQIPSRSPDTQSCDTESMITSGPAILLCGSLVTFPAAAESHIAVQSWFHGQALLLDINKAHSVTDRIAATRCRSSLRLVQVSGLGLA